MNKRCKKFILFTNWSDYYKPIKTNNAFNSNYTYMKVKEIKTKPCQLKNILI